MATTRCDIVVVGGGLVGLATAARILARKPGTKVVVLEKEERVARHQSSRNSGVLHAGLYYRPGSKKARMARLGKRAMERFCRAQGIPVERTGKLVVASAESQLPALSELERRAHANRVGVQRLTADEIPTVEPHARGVQALHVTETGRVDFGAVAHALERLLVEHGADLRLGERLLGYTPGASGVRVATDRGELEAACLVGCAGVHSDRVLELGGARSPVRIVPFRGDYLRLSSARSGLCRSAIYPVPDARFPFLGPHFTRMLNGTVECGPGAVVAFDREGYGRASFGLRDAMATLGFAGFWRLAARYWRTGAQEAWRAVSRRAMARELRKLVPSLRAEDLSQHRSGIRAQALRPDGTLEDDFVWVESPRQIHLVNAPSPGATASLVLGDGVAHKALARL